MKPKVALDSVASITVPFFFSLLVEPQISQLHALHSDSIALPRARKVT